MSIENTFAKWKNALLSYPGVQGVGIGLRRVEGKIKVPHERAIVVYVKEKGTTDRQLPREVDGVPVDVVGTGGIFAA